MIDQAAEVTALVSNNNGRLAHAFPEDSVVALCGYVRRGARPAGAGQPRCLECIYQAGRKSWVRR